MKPNGKFPEHLEEYAQMIERGNKNFALWAAKQSRHGLTLEERSPKLGGLRGLLSWLRGLVSPKERG